MCFDIFKCFGISIQTTKQESQHQFLLNIFTPNGLVSILTTIHGSSRSINAFSGEKVQIDFYITQQHNSGGKLVKIGP